MNGNIAKFPLQLYETNLFNVVADIAREQLTNQNVCFNAVAREPKMIIQIYIVKRTRHEGDKIMNVTLLTPTLWR